MSSERKERAIILRAHEVRAVLAGVKTQHRIRVDPRSFAGKWFADGGAADCRASCEFVADPGNFPPYFVGQRLWVQETWAHDAPDLHDLRVDVEDACGSSHGPYYRADVVHENAGLTWRPPPTMPRWASRITLDVTGVRVERLQDISEADARAEGVTPCMRCKGTGVDPIRIEHDPEWCSICGGTSQGVTHKDELAALWDTTHGKRAPWSSNPWVWVREFRRLTP